MTRTRHVVVWTDVALRDIERLAERLHQEAPLRAEQVLDRILTRAEKLATMPGRGRTPPELASLGDRAWLEVVESPWRIVYRIMGASVEIHGVLDGRRDLRDILLERMLDA